MEDPWRRPEQARSSRKEKKWYEALQYAAMLSPFGGRTDILRRACAQVKREVDLRSQGKGGKEASDGVV